jgi:PAS domain-containing protein
MFAKSTAAVDLSTADPPADIPAPDLTQFLDADPNPTFLIPIDARNPIAFNILLCNHALKAAHGLLPSIQGDTVSAIQFQSWTQAVVNWRENYDFAERRWTAFSIRGRWKAVRAIEQRGATSEGAVTRTAPNATSEDRSRNIKDASILGTRLESMQRMMEMSDVGVFEYDPQGTLIRANESWYNLSHHPRENEAHTDFSFMDLVYPPDKPLVMSQWNIRDAVESSNVKQAYGRRRRIPMDSFCLCANSG